MVVLMREVCICAARQGMGKEEKKITSLWNKLQSNNIRSSTPTSFVHLAKRTCIHGVVLLLREYTTTIYKKSYLKRTKKLNIKCKLFWLFAFAPTDVQCSMSCKN